MMVYLIFLSCIELFKEKKILEDSENVFRDQHTLI